MPAQRISVILASGEADKLLPVGVLAPGAAAMQREVEIVLTMWGVLAFRRGAIGDMPVSATFKDREAGFKDLLVWHKVPSLIAMLETAKEIGHVRIIACGMTMGLFGLRPEDLEDVVDGVAGVGEFIEMAKTGRSRSSSSLRVGGPRLPRAAAALACDLFQRIAVRLHWPARFGALLPAPRPANAMSARPP